MKPSKDRSLASCQPLLGGTYDAIAPQSQGGLPGGPLGSVEAGIWLSGTAFIIIPTTTTTTTTTTIRLRSIDIYL